MEPIYETVPPFIIRIYASYFAVVWEGFEEAEADRYQYEYIKSVYIDKDPEREKEFGEIVGLSILDIALGRNHTSAWSIDNRINFSELIIEMKNGEVKKRYLNEADPENLQEAVDMINERLKRGKDRSY